MPIHPIVVNGVTMLPMRKLFELLDADITWNASTQSVTAAREGRQVNVTVGSATAMVNGASTALDEAPIIENGYTMVPLRFAAETLGYTVEWDPKRMTIQLNSPDGEFKPVTAQTTRTLISDKTQRFYLTAFGSWEPKVIKTEIFNGADKSKGIFMQMESLMKKDLASDVTLPQVEELLGKVMDNLMTNAVKSKGIPLTVGHLQAVQFEVAGEVEYVKLKRLMTIYEAEDRFYLMQAWSLESKYQELVPLMKDMAKTFRLMDNEPTKSDGIRSSGETIQI